MGEKILVTGGAGFIGRAICNELLRRGNDVRVLDSLIEQVHCDRERPEDFPDEAELIVGDIRNKDVVARSLKGIDSVMEGHYWVGDNAVANVAASLRKFNVARRRTKAFGLTYRELEIVRAVVNGHTNKQIAEQFSISESTVKRHVTHIFDKLGASNRIEVALFAAHHRLLDGI